MSTHETTPSDQDTIRHLIGLYAEGPRIGKSDGMRPAFAGDAVMTSGGGANPIDSLFSFVDNNPPNPDIAADIRLLYVSGTVATAVVDVRNWGAAAYEDIFTLARTPDGWKIVSKTFRTVGN